MALELIDGTEAATSLLFNAIEYKCSIARWTASIDVDTYPATTFCSGGWKTERTGLKQLRGACNGFASYGDPSSDPSLLVVGVPRSGIPVVLTADSGCSFTGLFNFKTSMVGNTAAAMSERSMTFDSTGPVTTIWVIM